MSRVTYVLGIDGGLASMGWAILETSFDHDASEVAYAVHSAGVWTTQREAKKRQLHVGSDDGRRLDALADELFAKIAPLGDEGPEIDLFGYELPAGARGARAAHALGMAHGLVRGVLRGQSSIPVVEVTARDAKAALTRSAVATKDQMIERAAAAWSSILKLPKGQREHAADAIAVALAASRTQAGRSIVRRRQSERAA